MSETVMYLVGHVGTDIEHRRVGAGTDMARFRLAATPRRFDKAQNAYVDGTTNWMTVQCWRALAAHVTESVRRGDPVIVIGKLRTQEWVRDNQHFSRFILEASAVGHDLSRGVSRFTKAARVADRPAGPTTTPAAVVAAAPSDSGEVAGAVPEQGPRLLDAS